MGEQVSKGYPKTVNLVLFKIKIINIKNKSKELIRTSSMKFNKKDLEKSLLSV